MAALLAFGLHAATLTFQSIRAENSPLTYNDVYAIAQDNQGLMWIGTAEGVHRYDGRSFRIFDASTPGLPSTFIVSLLPDEGGVWIGTDAGVAYYDRETDCIRHFSLKSTDGRTITGKATAIAAGPGGNIWFAINEQGLFCYNRQSQTLINYFGSRDTRLPANIRSLFFYPDGRCLLSLYYKGLYYADPEQLKLTPVADGYFDGDNIVGILPAPQGGVYVVGPARGLVRISADSTVLPLYRPKGDFEPNSMSADANSNLWIAAIDGAHRFNTLREECEVLQHSDADPRSLGENSLRCVFTDSYGGLWAGSINSGISYANPGSRNFHRISLSCPGMSAPAQPTALSVDDEGNIWCSTRRAGLFRISAGGKTSTHIEAGLPTELFNVCACDNSVWVTSLDGIYRLDRSTMAVKRYSHIALAEPLKEIRLARLCRLADDRLMLATTLGLYEYSRLTDSFEEYSGLSKCFVTGVEADREGRLWLSTFAHGVICYDPLERRIISRYHLGSRIHHLPCDKVVDIRVDAKGNVWAATFGSGIVKITRNDSIMVYNLTSPDGYFPCNVALQIFCDGIGSVWATTNKGLVAMDPAGTTPSVYTTAQGLLNDNFTGSLGVVAPDGAIYLASADGVTFFKPLELSYRSRKHAPVITDIFVDGLRLAPAENKEAGSNPDFASTIELSENQRDIEIHISDPALLSADIAVRAYYRLDPTGEWKPMPDNGTISFPFLPAGDHTLEFREASAGDAWEPYHAPVRLHVAQAFYKTPLALGIYAVLLVAVVMGLWKFTDDYNRRRLIRAREKMRWQQEIESYHEKMVLFSTVVNRLKSPLAMIRPPLDNIIHAEGHTEEIAADMRVISDGADRLSRLLNEFADFHSDRCTYLLDKQPVNLHEIFRKRIGSLGSLAPTRFELAGDENVCVDADPSALDRLVDAAVTSVTILGCTTCRVDIGRDDAGGTAIVSMLCQGVSLTREQAYRLIYPCILPDESASDDAMRSLLPLVKFIAGLHGGSVEMTACDGSWPTIGISLPAAIDRQDVEKDVTPIGSVLVVENTAGSLASIGQRIKSTFRVVAVQSPVVAADLLQRDRFCAVVAEATPTNLMGITLCRQLTAEKSNIPVIVVTDKGVEDSLGREAVSSGAAMVVDKTRDPAFVEECVHAAVRRAGTASLSAPLQAPLQGPLQPLSDEDVRFIQELDRLVTANIADPELNNEQLAEKMCMSKSTLIRRTRKTLQMTPKSYILKVRLAMSAQMLLKSSGRINEICYATGFNTPSYFAKCFKRAYGCLPSEYKGQPQRDIQDPADNTPDES